MRKKTLALFAAVLGACVVSLAAAGTPANAVTPTGCTRYVYGQGGTGSCVTYIQTMVSIIDNAQRIPGGNIARDGIFGPATKAAVVSYQSLYKLSADGVVGPNTWNRICTPTNFSWSYPYHPSATDISQYNAAWSAAGCQSLFPWSSYGLGLA